MFCSGRCLWLSRCRPVRLLYDVLLLLMMWSVTRHLCTNNLIHLQKGGCLSAVSCHYTHGKSNADSFTCPSHLFVFDKIIDKFTSSPVSDLVSYHYENEYSHYFTAVGKPISAKWSDNFVDISHHKTLNK